MIDYNRLAADYAQHRKVNPEVLRSLLETGGVTSTTRTLEVGCGTANYLIAIRSATGCPCWGMDPSEKMLASAQERAPEVPFQIGKAENLEYSDGSFDLIFSVDVIHHVGDRPAYFREAFRTLRPGGLVCTVTDSEDIIRRRQPLSTYFPDTIEAELRRYPPVPQLVEWMEQVGFSDLRQDRVEFPYPLNDISIYRDRAFSALYLICENAFQTGITRMEEDLKNGPIACVSRYVLLWGRKPAPIPTA